MTGNSDFPPLNTPIAHDGSPECPVDPETITTVVYKDEACELGVIPKTARTRFWREVTTYTITERAPADRVAELEAAILVFKEASVADMALPFDSEGMNGPKAQATIQVLKAKDALFATLKGTTE